MKHNSDTTHIFRSPAISHYRQKHLETRAVSRGIKRTACGQRVGRQLHPAAHQSYQRHFGFFFFLMRITRDLFAIVMLLQLISSYNIYLFVVSNFLVPRLGAKVDEVHDPA